MTYIILDVATTPMENASDFLETPTPPSNYTKPDTIAAWVAKTKEEQLAKAGLDLDLCRISGFGWKVIDVGAETQANVQTCEHGYLERAILEDIAVLMQAHRDVVLIGYNSLKFDWPVLMRRAMYLGVTFPRISLDRYKTHHIDLYDKLTQHGTLQGKSLGFYAKRLGMTDLVKPLSGEQESQVFTTGQWEALRQSIRHDVEATTRLARWMGVL